MVASNKEKTSVPHDRVAQIVKDAGLELVEKSAFLMAGPKDGPHLAIARTKKVSRVYLYNLQIDHPAVLKRDEQYRKEMRYGGIEAEVDFEQPEDLVVSAIEAMAGAVKAAADAPKVEPIEKPKKERAPRKAKPVLTPVVSSDDDDDDDLDAVEA